jgi:hypothetical protein
MSREKTCYCHRCKKEFHPQGIARHRAMHRDKKQDVTITFTDGRQVKWRYGKDQL